MKRWGWILDPLRCKTHWWSGTSLKVNDTYQRKCRIYNEEEKVLRWATHHVIPDDELLDYLAGHKYAILQDYIDYFQVAEDFLMKKLRKKI